MIKTVNEVSQTRHFKGENKVAKRMVTNESMTPTVLDYWD